MPFLPLHDLNRVRNIQFQRVTVGLIGLCVIVFLWQLTLGEDDFTRAILSYGSIPAALFDHVVRPPQISRGPDEMTLITSLFLHGGWSHLIFNMLFLWVFGDNVEDAIGHLRFLAFFLLCGAIAQFTDAMMDRGVMIPTIGASGAISGVLGAYFILYPRARLLVLALSFLPLRIPAWVAILGWLGQDLYFGLLGGNAAGGVAWWAHIGGFAAGALLIIPVRRRRVEPFGHDRGPWTD